MLEKVKFHENRWWSFCRVYPINISLLYFNSEICKVIKAKICIRITMLEYILVIWLIGIQAERIRKFLALPSKSFGDKILLASKDKWNFIYFLSLVTFISGLSLRVVSTLDYKGNNGFWSSKTIWPVGYSENRFHPWVRILDLILV